MLLRQCLRRSGHASVRALRHVHSSAQPSPRVSPAPCRLRRELQRSRVPCSQPRGLPDGPVEPLLSQLNEPAAAPAPLRPLPRAPVAPVPGRWRDAAFLAAPPHHTPPPSPSHAALQDFDAVSIAGRISGSSEPPNSIPWDAQSGYNSTAAPALRQAGAPDAELLARLRTATLDAEVTWAALAAETLLWARGNTSVGAMPGGRRLEFYASSAGPMVQAPVFGARNWVPGTPPAAAEQAWANRLEVRACPYASPPGHVPPPVCSCHASAGAHTPPCHARHCVRAPLSHLCCRGERRRQQ